MDKPELAMNLKKFSLNPTYLNQDIQNKLTRLILKELLLDISPKVKEAPCYAIIVE